jgi:S-adenosylmethionine:tRNA ribosyltransferase-isomerase
MKTADFEYLLPESLIAHKPPSERTGSRLLVLRRDGKTEHRHFFDLPSYLDPGDFLIINNTKVFPARLIGTRTDGRLMDILLVRETSPGIWEILSRGNFSGKLKISEDLQADIREGTSAQFQTSGDLMELIWKYGDMPLPPYIRRSPDQSDKLTYQTVYAANEGSIAAPTAGLHFTNRLLDDIVARGVNVRRLTLHVGIGTFRPIRTESLEDHSMEREYFEIPDELIAEIEQAKTMGKRIIAVGTTTTRSLEGYFSGSYNNGSAASTSATSRVATGGHRSIRGTTDIFIYPGYTFRAVDALITNFHLPRSTPLMLVSAFAGRENILSAYQEAIAKRYRFLSYGDAMLIL